MGAKINPAAGCTVRGEKEREKKREKKREIYKLRAQIELYVLYNIKKHCSVDIALGRG